MKAFMDEEFLLTTPTASRLYHEYAEGRPIADCHTHLSAREIAQNQRCENLAQLWLSADHYKWRAMRACGVPERFVTGDAPEYEKFEQYARVMPRLIGGPVYHWTQLELKRYFGIDEPLCAQNAQKIWDATAAALCTDGFDAVGLISRMNVRTVCTTDDPTDDLRWHTAINADSRIPFRVLPSFRPDRFLHIDQPQWRSALSSLGADSWATLQRALSGALDRFIAAGCRASDHGFPHFGYAEGDPAPVMEKALNNDALTEREVAVYRGALMRFLAEEYTRRDMVMQLHLGPKRNTSPKLWASFGADAGADSIGERTDPHQLAAFLGRLEGDGTLPKTILYGLNPDDNDMLVTMAVNFASDGARVQYGAAWWMQDHIRGIERQLALLMETGQLCASVGMLTDSRSFTAFVRHEYYRRILCRQLGAIVERGEYPSDMGTLGAMIEDVCYHNAVRFFGFA